MVDLVFQAPVVERLQKLLNLGYKVSYTTWPFTSNIGVPLPSTQVWEYDFGGMRLEAEYGLEATLILLDEAIASLQTEAEICNCSAIDLFRYGCNC